MLHFQILTLILSQSVFVE